MAKTIKTHHVDNRGNAIEISSTSFRAAFPEIWEEIYQSGVQAGRAQERKETAAKRAEAEAMQAKAPKPPTPEDLLIQEAKLPLEERAKREWLRNKDLQKEFRMSGFQGYLSILRQQEAHDNRLKRRAS